MGVYQGQDDLRLILHFDHDDIACFTCGESLDPNAPAVYWSGWGGAAFPEKNIVLHPHCAIELSVKLIADARRLLAKVRVVA